MIQFDKIKFYNKNVKNQNNNMKELSKLIVNKFKIKKVFKKSIQNKY